MKAILGSLLCVVLATSEAFAISGGPQYPGGTNLVGTYAGVLQPMFDPTNPSSSNSIGVFSLGVPSSGMGGGTFVMFTQGRVFSGTIQGVGDPNKASINGVLTASYSFTKIASATGVSFQVTASVKGSLKAKVAPSSGSNGSTALRLSGSSTLYTDQGQITATNAPIITQVLTLAVTGFKQSSTAGTSVSPTASAAPTG